MGGTVRTLIGGTPAIVLVLALVAAGCRRSASEAVGGDPAARTDADTSAAAGGWFTDVAARSGLTFTHFNGMSGEFTIAEVMAPGVALFDFDNDGDLDLYAVQGLPLDPRRTAAVPRDRSTLGDRLYRNDLETRPDGTRVVRFTDVTAASGVHPPGYGMGVAAGDYDNDGWVDLYLTRFGPNVLLHNNGDGTFTDVATRAHTADDAWSVSATFVDYDRDGWLDLYVADYLNYRVESDTPCFAPSGARDYCAPAAYRPAADRLFRNRGDGTFADVTAQAHIAGTGPALGVVAADFDGDGWQDIYVANDGRPNKLWMNRHDGTFADTALAAGVAVSGDGRSEGSMGVDAGDADDDGDDDLIVTNIAGEGHDLYVNDGTGTFEDRSTPARLTAPTLPFTGFGTSFVDVDNDGWLDVFTANGAIHTIDAQVRRGEPYPLRQHLQLFRNTGDGRFEETTARAGAVFSQLDVGRGAAFGDIDNDGDVDIVVANSNGPLRLLLNTPPHHAHWIGLRAVGGRLSRRAAGSPPAARDMLGATIVVTTAGGRERRRHVHTDGSYASASDPRVLVGLGSDAAPVRVRITWPDGRRQEFRDLAIDRWTTVTQREEP